MEVVKSYKIQVKAPRDLIEDYFGLKQKVLNTIFSHVKLSKSNKAHFELNKESWKKLRGELLRGWKYSKHYVDSAINSVVGLVKGWVTLYNKGKAKEAPKVTRKTVYVKNTLFSYRGDVLKISVEPNRRYLTVDLTRYKWIPRDFDKVGGLLLTEKELVITVKKRFEPKPCKWSSFDINLTNVTALIDGKVKRYDLRKLYHVHRAYELKRAKIQKLSKLKPETSKKLLAKYSKREANRTKDFLHKLTSAVAKELKALEAERYSKT